MHRVQRVPATEASGRIHTSTATVAVLPEAEEVDVQIDPKDLRVDTFCSSGPGGQSVNTTYSAVRVTHLPTGIVVSQQDEKSQIKNRQKAMKVLRSRLYEMEMRKQQDAIAKERRGQVGTGERSEKIRTYNFKENRITDHRINFTMHQLPNALDGDLDELIAELEARAEADKLREATEASRPQPVATRDGPELDTPIISDPVAERCRRGGATLVAGRGHAADEARRDAARARALAARVGRGRAGSRDRRAAHAGRFDERLERRRSRGAPPRPDSAYLTGDPRVLRPPLPRHAGRADSAPETELVVEEALASARRDDWSRRRRAPARVDVGTGSGCLAITLALEQPEARRDRDRHLATGARRRATRTPSASASPSASSFVGMRPAAALDAPRRRLIVANPPYVAETDRATLAPEVRDLRAGRGALRRAGRPRCHPQLVPAAAARALAPGGWLVMEIGAGQAAAVTATSSKRRRVSCSTASRPDLQAIPRVIVAARRRRAR